MIPETIPKLLAVKEAILRHPTLVDMDTFYGEQHCGTTACIAGWVVSMDKGSTLPDPNDDSINPATVAARILHLDRMEQSRLFFVGTWPGDLRRALYRAGNDKERYAGIVAERIDRFILTKGAS